MRRREHESPTPVVDVIIEVEGGIVLIERANPPPGWALPGGFVDEGESLSDAAKREAREETCLEVELLEQFFCYSEPSRDPRQHTISTVFIARAEGTPVGADDAKVAKVYSPEDLPQLAFDHGEIVADYLRYRESGRRPAASR